jgi:hypothetical protein
VTEFGGGQANKDCLVQNPLKDMRLLAESPGEKRYHLKVEDLLMPIGLSRKIKPASILAGELEEMKDSFPVSQLSTRISAISIPQSLFIFHQ